MTRHRTDRTLPPLGAADLERLALAYVGRYATTRARLAAYLQRKLRERNGTADDGGAAPGAVERVVERCAALGYVDDRLFAEMRGAALTRRGYGARRVSEALRAAGIGENDSAEARAQASDAAWAAALAFARKRRIGPFAAAPLEPDKRRKAFAAMIRAGHGPDIARLFVDATPGEPPVPPD